MTNQDIRSFVRLGLLKFKIASKWKISISAVASAITKSHRKICAIENCLAIGFYCNFRI